MKYFSLGLVLILLGALCITVGQCFLMYDVRIAAFLLKVGLGLAVASFFVALTVLLRSK